MTVVTAPTGFGKSLLLAAWHARLADEGRAWLSLDEECRNPPALAAALAAALRHAGLKETELKALAEAATSRVFSVRLAEIVSARDRGPLTLFLDGYDRIAGSPAAHWIADVAMRLVGHVFWAIAGRIVSLSALSPLRVQGFLQVVSDDDLRLTARDTSAVLGRRLARPEREAIEARLEGWPIAVQALRQQMADSGVTIEDALARLTRRRGMLSDYIDSELIAPLPPDLAAFLLDVSILSEIDAGTVDLVRNRADSRRMIAALDPLGSLLRERTPDRWRLHPLLREHLEALFERQPETDIVARRMAAAHLLIARQDYIGAVRNALLAGSPRAAVELIAAIGPVRLWARFGFNYMQRVLSMLPTDLVAAHPEMRMADVMAMISEGRVAAAVSLLEDIRIYAQRLTDRARRQDFEAEIASVAVMITIVHDVISEDALSEMRVYSAANASRLSEEIAMETASLAIIAHQQWGELEEAEQLIPFAHQKIRRWGSSFNDYFLEIYLGWIVQARGRPEEAIVHYRRALSMIADLDDIGLRSLAETAIVEALYVIGDFKAAAEQAEAWLGPLERSMAWYDFFAATYGTLALLRLSSEGINAALAVVERMRLAALDREAASLLRLIEPLKLVLLMRTGSWRTARLHVVEHQLDALCAAISSDHRQSAWRERDMLRGAMAEFYIGTGNLAEARTCIEEMAEDAAKGGRTATTLRARLLRAALVWRQGARGQAVALLGEAIEEVVATKQSGLLMTQVYMLEPLLSALRQAKIMRTATARRMLDTLAADAARRKAARSSQLTPREHEVLTLVGAGDSNKNIARRLAVSENTVKFHLKRIAVKVDAVGSSRIVLVHAARQQGIFS